MVFGLELTPGRKARSGALEVRTYGDPVLRQASVPVKQVTDELRDFAEQMVEAMFRYDGIGLAAPQVGRNIRMVALGLGLPEDGLPPNASPGEREILPQTPLIILNPEVVGTSAIRESAEEGCLSLPKIYAVVERSAAVTVRFSLLNGETVTAEYGGLLGRCLQHEIDHLDGVVFADRLSEEEKERVQADLKALKKETRRRLKQHSGNPLQEPYDR